MTLNPEFVYCQGCGVEITWSPYIANSQHYCCEECSRGIQCRCAERMELDDDRKSSSSGTPPPYE